MASSSASCSLGMVCHPSMFQFVTMIRTSPSDCFEHRDHWGVVAPLPGFLIDDRFA